MKTLFLFFIPLMAVTVHATPTIRNDRMESFQAIYSLDKCAHQKEITVSCVHCGPGPIEEYCRECPDKGWFGMCLNTHWQTCGWGDAIPTGKSCPTGSWGCITDCCKD